MFSRGMLPPVASHTRIASLCAESIPSTSKAGRAAATRVSGPGPGLADLHPVFGQKGLVRGHDRFPLSDRIVEEFQGGALSPHKLANDVDVRVPGHLESVGGQGFARPRT